MPTLLAQLEIASPGRLLVLVLLPALVYLALRGRGDLARWQQATSTALRCLVFSLLCLAWAAPSCRQESQRAYVAVVVDGSASSASAAAEQWNDWAEMDPAEYTGHQLSFLTFSETPNRPVSPDEAGLTQTLPDASATNIANALTLAQASCPPNRVPGIVLLSDGLETHGDALAVAIAADIPISVVPLESFSQPEMAVDAVIAPPDAVPGEAFEIAVRVIARRAGEARLTLRRDGEAIAEEVMTVPAGEFLWRTQTQLGDGAASVFTATITASADTHSENNQLSTVVVRRSRMHVMFVTSNAPTRWPEQATSDGRWLMSVVQAEAFPQERTKLSGYDLVVLIDQAAGNFSPRQLAALDGYVRGGGGLIATGGDATFGAAAYELTALEKMLPVVATDQPIEQQKSLALVLVVDKSKSMEQENRLSLAKEAAKKVADVLQERDQVGVLAFGNESQWISRLAPLDNKEELLGRIDQLTAEGLTNMYPAIQRAYLSLSQADADSRHVILLTDGVPTPGDFDQIAKQMAEAGITVSTVSLGSGADQTILQDISRIAQGNHYHVDDPDDLPRILERETRTAAAKVTSSEFFASAQRQLPGLELRGAPPLSAYVATNFKPGARVLLTAGEGDPLLAWWRHGRGKAMVFTSDLSQSASAWQRWDGRDAFWNRLLAYAARDPSVETARLDVTQRNGKVTVTFDAVHQTDFAYAHAVEGSAKLRIEPIRRSASQSTELRMRQIAPGRYQATFAAEPNDTFVLQATLTSGEEKIAQAKRGVAIHYSEEFFLRPTAERTLRSIAVATGGKYDMHPSDLFFPDGRTVDVLFPLWPYLLVLALLLYLGETAVRRLPRKHVAQNVANLKRAA